MANWQQNEQLADITADLPRFSDALERFTARLGLEIAGLDADHISLRCHQNTTAERWRRGLEQCGTLAVGEYDQRPAHLPVQTGGAGLRGALALPYR